MAHPDLSFAPVWQLAPLIRSGELSPVTLTEHCLTRIARFDGFFHAFVDVYAEDALKAAKLAERMIAAGQYLSPLHGIPVAIKDLVDIKGKQTTAGCNRWTGRIAEETATIIDLLEAAGAIIVGKTHMVEFALGGWGTNQPMGTPHNPWDLRTHRIPGGSSSGSAVAVAAGMVPVAIGSDTGGSIRGPAAYCGIVGLKATFGQVSNHGLVPLAPSLDTVGPLVRSVEDAAIVHDILAKADPNDLATLDVPRNGPIHGQVRKPIKGMRLGVLAEDQLSTAKPEVLAAFRQAVEHLQSLGAEIEEIRMPRALADYTPVSGTILLAEAYANHGAYVSEALELHDPGVGARMMLGKNTTAATYIGAMQQRQRDQVEAYRLFSRVDAILAPTTPFPAIPVAEVDELNLAPTSFTRMGNYLGLCGMAVPCGFTDGGLPMSLQILARPHDEATAARIAWNFEASTDHHLRRPEMPA